MKLSPADWIAGGALILSLIANILGAIAWMSSAAKKRYAAERDFGHLRRNQEQMSQGINLLMEEMKSQFNTLERDLLEIKFILGKDPNK